MFALSNNTNYLFVTGGITVLVKAIAKPIQKDGVEYLQADKVITKVKIAHGQLALDDTERPGAGNYKIKYACV